MAEIKEFKVIHYNPEIVSISKVVAPPYDVIDNNKREYLKSLSPYNVVRVILNDSSQNPYEQAACLFLQWLEKKILIWDECESFYIYAQKFQYNLQEYIRYGFIGLLKLEEPGSNVFLHERTYAAPKEDRFRLLKAVKANLSPVFTIFSDPQRYILNIILKETQHSPPLFDFEFEGITNTVWRISSPKVVEKIKTAFQDKSILIADGHHRYEVALHYRNLMRSQEDFPQMETFDYCMCYFAPIEQDGLLILPTHRLVKLPMPWENYHEKIKSLFSLTEMESYIQLFDAMAKRKMRLGFYNRRFYLLEFKKKDILQKNDPLASLDVTILHRFLLGETMNYDGEISYIEDYNQAIKLVDEGKYSGVFFLNPTSVNEVIDIAKQNMRMPYKSTYFYPKILTGITFYKF
ncbi:MAG TPA: DUF1015 domain-containing protein [Candidatus Omnitrophica bacterium]|nr:DUF1015 domain-containing protein [Candidatus Omnitrophota bacterium]